MTSDQWSLHSANSSESLLVMILAPKSGVYTFIGHMHLFVLEAIYQLEGVALGPVHFQCLPFSGNIAPCNGTFLSFPSYKF